RSRRAPTSSAASATFGTESESFRRQVSGPSAKSAVRAPSLRAKRQDWGRMSSLWPKGHVSGPSVESAAVGVKAAAFRAGFAAVSGEAQPLDASLPVLHLPSVPGRPCRIFAWIDAVTGVVGETGESMKREYKMIPGQVPNGGAQVSAIHSRLRCIRGVARLRR